MTAREKAEAIHERNVTNLLIGIAQPLERIIDYTLADSNTDDTTRAFCEIMKEFITLHNTYEITPRAVQAMTAANTLAARIPQKKRGHRTKDNMFQYPER